MPSRGRKTQIRNLGVGSQFQIVPAGGPYAGTNQTWMIISRPSKSGGVWYVQAIYVASGKEDQTTEQSKYFSLNSDVVEVKPASKTFAAIDQRDQPKTRDGRPIVSPINEVARGQGQDLVDFDEEEEGELGAFADDQDEKEKVKDGAD